MRVFWMVVDRISPVLLLTGLVAPILGCFCGAVYGARGRQQSGEYLTGRWAGRGFLLGAFAPVPLLYLAMCTPPPGEGRIANDGFRRGATLLNALDSYRTQFGVYPDSLTRLVPRFVPESALAGPKSHFPFDLRRVGDQFELTFH